MAHRERNQRPISETALDEAFATFQAQMAGFPPGFKKPTFQEWIRQRESAAGAFSRPRVGAAPPSPFPTREEQIRGKVTRGAAESALGGLGITPAPPTPTTPTQQPFPGQEGGRDIITQPDGSTGWWGTDPVTQQFKWNQLTGPTRQERETRPAPGPETFTNSQGQTMTWDGQKYVQTGFDPENIFEPPPAPAPSVPTELSPFQRGSLDVQRQQLQFQQQQAQQQTELQRQAEMARLSANPINWLQFAAFTGEQPVIQPWMIPLGFQQFGGAGGTGTPQIAPQGTQIGQPLPGLQATDGGFDFSGLQALTTPSAQFLSRAGPTATQQFLGFERARTGASPQETQFRLHTGAAPTGRFGGFSRFR